MVCQGPTTILATTIVGNFQPAPRTPLVLKTLSTPFACCETASSRKTQRRCAIRSRVSVEIAAGGARHYYIVTLTLYITRHPRTYCYYM